MNSYEACSRHINGHLSYCCLCQEESLRDLLREVANSLVIDTFEASGIFAGTIQVHITKETWKKIVPLRAKEAVEHGQEAQAASDQAPSG